MTGIIPHRRNRRRVHIRNIPFTWKCHQQWLYHDLARRRIAARLRRGFRGEERSEKLGTCEEVKCGLSFDCRCDGVAAVRLPNVAFGAAGEWPDRTSGGSPGISGREPLDRLLAERFAEIARAKTELEAEKELVIGCQRRVDQNTTEETRLANRIKAALSNGAADDAANEYAMSLAHVREQLASNVDQLAKHKANYEACAKGGNRAKAIMETKQKARELGIEFQESQRKAHLSRFAEEFSSGDSAGRVDSAMSRLQEQIDLNKAKAAVANDLRETPSMESSEADVQRQATADAILAEFAEKK